MIFISIFNFQVNLVYVGVIVGIVELIDTFVSALIETEYFLSCEANCYVKS